MAALTNSNPASSFTQLSMPTASPAIANNPALKGLASNITFNPAGNIVPVASAQAAGVAPTVTPKTTPTGSGSPLTGNYTIAQGDTLNTIAAKYGTSAAELASANGIDNPNLIQAGATLRVPSDMAPVSTTAAVTPPLSSSYASSLAPTSAFTVDTSGALPSSALGSADGTNGDNSPTNMSYAQAVQGLYGATQYSPDYLAAQQGVNAANLKASSDQVAGNYQGDTTDFAQGITARQEQTDALNTTQAQNALQIQTLLRSGNIAAATALANAYAPTSVSAGSSLVNPVTGQETYSGLGGYQAVQGIQTVNNLANEYPDAGIDPTDSLVTAQQKAAQAPSFAAKQSITVALPGGGTEILNKNSQGVYTVVSSADAASGAAAAKALSDLTTQRSQIASSIGAVDNNFPLLTGIVSKYGLNTSVPLINQFTNMADQQVGNSGVTQLNAVVDGLRASINSILSRGGSVTNSVRDEANNLLPSNATLPVLQDLYNTVKAEGNGVLSGIDSQISQQQATLNGGGSTTTSGSGGLYDF